MTNDVVSVVQSIPVVGGDIAPAASWISEHGLEMLSRLVSALVIFVIGVIVVKLVTAMVGKALEKTKRVNALLEKFLLSIVSKTGWALVIMVVLGKLGVDIGPLVAGLGVTGFIIGFACQESLSNLAAGIMIALNSPFKVGDYVIAGGIEGSVKELNMMATVLTTPDNKRITVPNKGVWGGPITNFNALGTRRVDMTVGIAYGSDMAKALEIAASVTASVPGVLQDPPLAVSIAGLDSSAITLNIRPWANSADYWGVRSAVQKAVKEAFDKNGIEIPFQQIDVRMKTA